MLGLYCLVDLQVLVDFIFVHQGVTENDITVRLIQKIALVFPVNSVDSQHLFGYIQCFRQVVMSLFDKLAGNLKFAAGGVV